MDGLGRMVFDGYVRVSQVGMRQGERFISPSVQEDRIRAWGALSGARVLEVFVELDESGGRADRPLLETAIGRIEDGITHGVVVAKIDRFGRSLLDGLAAIERIHQAGGRFVSVQDGFDATTDAGRLVLRIMLSMAEFELERYRSQFEEANARAIGRGVYTGSWTPVGYRRLPSGRLKPDGRTGPVIQELFARRAAGEPLNALARWIEDKGVLTAKGNPGWSSTHVARLVANRVYIGRVARGPYENESAHPPLVDAVLWQAAQRPRQLGTFHGQRVAPLAGLVRCASCGMSVTSRPAPDRGSGGRCYSCRAHHAAGRCPAPAHMMAGPLEGRVYAVMWRLLERRAPGERELAGAEQAAAAAHRDMIAYRDTPDLLRVLGRDKFADGLEARMDRLREARLDAAELRSRLATCGLPATERLRAQWRGMTASERRRIVAQLIDCVFVEPGRGDYDWRIVVCPAGTGPRNLPRAGDKGSPLRRYPYRPSWLRPWPGPVTPRASSAS